MTRKIILAAALLFGLAVSAAAQESGRKWSLEECIEWAEGHNISIEQQQIAVENSELDLSTTRNSRLPNLNANAGQNFNFGRSPNMATGVYEASQTASTSIGMSSSTEVFSGMRIARQIEADRLNLRAALAGLDRVRENLGLNVASYYLDVLLKKELLKVAGEQAALTERQVDNTAAMVGEGKVPESQLFDIQAQLAQNRVSVIDAQNSLALALLDLTQLLNIETDPGFDVLEPDTARFMARNAAADLSPDAIYGIALEVKPQVLQARYLLESSRSSVRVAQSSRYPSVSLGLSYNSGFSHVFGADGTMPFFDQVRNNRRQAVGVSINVPIFSRLSTRNRIRSAKLGVRSRELELENVKQVLYKEIQQAWQSATAARERYMATEQAWEAASAAYDAAQTRYEVGRSTAYEFSEAQMRLFSTRSEQLQAKYDYVFRARILDFYRGEPIEIK